MCSSLSEPGIGVDLHDAVSPYSNSYYMEPFMERVTYSTWENISSFSNNRTS